MNEGIREREAAPPAEAGANTLTLQTKFLLGVATLLVLLCLAAAGMVYHHEKRLLEEAAIEKSQLVMAAVESARSYVRETLRPTMYEVLGPDSFVLEAMSTSYVGRAVMDRFKQSMPDYVWRRVAENARNPEYAPRPFETRMIEYFKDDPKTDFWQGIVQIDGRSSFVHVRPVYFKESCLRCHGDPGDAPKALLDIYGSERGFGHAAGSIAGVSAVSIPVDVALAKIRERALSLFGGGLLAVALMFVMISFLFNRMVIHSLRDLLNIFRQGLRGQEELELFHQAAAKDEIDELTAAATVMSAHLSRARRQLEQYAENLEEMVDERTRALTVSEETLKLKVAARNQELKTLNVVAELITASDSLEIVLPRILDRVLALVPAQGAAIYLLRDTPTRLELEWKKNADKLNPNVDLDSKRRDAVRQGRIEDLPTSLAEAAGGRMSLFPCRMNGPCLNIPLVCRGKVLGVMAFVGVVFKEVTDEMRALLLSIGRQTGITIESLRNIEELVAGKELLQSVFNGITDMVVLLDRDMKISMVNKAHLDYFRCSEQDVLNRICRGEGICRTCPFYRCDMEKALETGQPFSEDVLAANNRMFRVYFYPIKDDRNEVVHIVRFAKDVTVEREVDRRIQQTEKMASLGQLSAGVAHEINNPLGVILCHTDLLKSELAEFPQGLADVTTIEKHAGNCQRIVADLLKFARGQETERRPVPLNTGVEEVVQMIRAQFKRRRCTIETHLAGNLPLIPLDVNKMKQVYLNMLMNAQHAQREKKGLIRVFTRRSRDGRSAEIEFWDNGAGIPPDIMDKIFDPFFSTKKTGEGTGLGLSVSYGIVQDHGGSIQVDSQPGEWTRFVINLPFEEGQSS